MLYQRVANRACQECEGSVPFQATSLADSTSHYNACSRWGNFRQNDPAQVPLPHVHWPLLQHCARRFHSHNRYRVGNMPSRLCRGRSWNPSSSRTFAAATVVVVIVVIMAIALAIAVIVVAIAVTVAVIVVAVPLP